MKEHGILMNGATDHLANVHPEGTILLRMARTRHMDNLEIEHAEMTFWRSCLWVSAAIKDAVNMRYDVLTEQVAA